jgi:hypothetical protein
MAIKGGNSFGAFKNKGTAFGTFGAQDIPDIDKIKPITTEFSKGSVPNSIVRMDRESAWSRWRRGYEISTAVGIQHALTYPFEYQIPSPDGTPPAEGRQPLILGVVQGFFTAGKEFGVHWVGCRIGSILRFDNVRDSIGTPATIASITEDDEFWYVQLAGSWSTTNPLPPPLYVPNPSGDPIKPLLGEILEDRILAVGGSPITKDTLDPSTSKRYGYVQAILIDVDGPNGILKLQKSSSFEASPDNLYLTPATKTFSVGRFFTVGTRYACTCQDFSRRSYSFMMNLEGSEKKRFPFTRPALLKYGRSEVLTDPNTGSVNNSAMTDANQNRDLALATQSIDNPGVYNDFGGRYLRNFSAARRAEGPTTFVDYTAKNNQITSYTDYWSPLLDEMRYCKHIYALRFEEGILPPEPSDLPFATEESITEWEQRLVYEMSVTNKHINDMQAVRGMALMDVPPKNFQSPVMLPMMQKLLNVPASFIRLENFRMQDKTGAFYNPSAGEYPAN